MERNLFFELFVIKQAPGSMATGFQSFRQSANTNSFLCSEIKYVVT